MLSPKDKNYYCIDCEKEIDKRGRTKRCKSCAMKEIRRNKEWGIIHGKNRKNYLNFCIDCNKKVSNYKQTRCRTCNIKYRKINRKKYYCKDCFKEISSKKSKRCQKCYHKWAEKTGLRKGSKNGMFGKKSPNYKGLPKCKDCGKTLANWYAERCLDCFHEWEKGKNNGNWRNGKSREPYPLNWNEQLKDKIRVRDNFICQLCGIPELECNRRLNVHHIDYNKNNVNLNNLISLCSSCHGKTNNNRKHWNKYFKEKIKCSVN